MGGAAAAACGVAEAAGAAENCAGVAVWWQLCRPVLGVPGMVLGLLDAKFHVVRSKNGQRYALVAIRNGPIQILVDQRENGRPPIRSL